MGVGRYFCWTLSFVLFITVYEEIITKHYARHFRHHFTFKGKEILNSVLCINKSLIDHRDGTLPLPPLPPPAFSWIMTMRFTSVLFSCTESCHLAQSCGVQLCFCLFLCSFVHSVNRSNLLPTRKQVVDLCTRLPPARTYSMTWTDTRLW